MHPSTLRDACECQQATQSALITVCIGNGQLRAARDVYEETLRQGIAPHLHAYNCLINAYAAHFRLGDVVRGRLHTRLQWSCGPDCEVQPSRAAQERDDRA
jgi:pentatricopeptide repeat protein